MNILSVMSAKALRRVTAIGRLYMPDVAQRLVERYGFIKSPRTVEDLLPPEGQSVNFGHGRLVHGDRTIVIDTLQVFGNLLIVDSGTTTDDADIFVDDMLTEAVPTIAIDPNFPRMYASQLEVQLGARLSSESPAAVALARQLTDTVRSYLPPQLAEREWNVQFELSAVHMMIDPSTQFALPCEWKLERRVGHPYVANIYAAQAPLRTSDHVTVLEALERSGLARDKSGVK